MLGDAIELKAVYSRSNKSASAFARDAQDVLKLKNPLDVYHDEDPEVSLDAFFPDLTSLRSLSYYRSLYSRA